MKKVEFFSQSLRFGAESVQKKTVADCTLPKLPVAIKPLIALLISE